MHPWKLFSSVVVIAAVVTFTDAVEPNQQPVPYSVNIFFVPPIMAAKCPLGQFWHPTTMVCSMCFCLTGGLSRCVPQPGCDPSATTSTPPITGGGGPGASIIAGANSTISTATQQPANSTAAPATVPVTVPPALPLTNATTTPPHSLPVRARRSRSPRFDMFNRED